MSPYEASPIPSPPATEASLEPIDLGAGRVVDASTVEFRLKRPCRYFPSRGMLSPGHCRRPARPASYDP